MPKVSKNLKNNSKLICITGFSGHGKTSSINILNNLGYKTFIVDLWVHKIYKKNKIGYFLIKKLFGNQFVNEIEVDRKKLKELILSNALAKKLLEKNMNKLIYKKILGYKKKNKLIFVELGTYLFFESIFYNLFNQIFVIYNPEKNKTMSEFQKISQIKKFSTISVENYEKHRKNGTFFCDLIVDNLLDLNSLKQWWIKNILNLISFL